MSGSELGRYRPYAEYKESGVEWLGEIPEHWETSRIKNSAPISDTRISDDLGRFSYVALENIESGTGRLVELNEGTPEGTVSIFHSGDVLFGKLRPYLAKVIQVGFDGICSTELVVLRPEPEVFQNFLAMQLLSSGFIKWIDAMTYGTKMPRVSPDQLVSQHISIPPLPEQRAIAAFLDRETARIDELVAHKRRLIELLQEQRSALITQAVTQGLDPDVEMKESGVEWLGRVPVGWEITRLAFVATGIGDGIHATPQYVDESDFFFINGNNLVDGLIRINPSTKCVDLQEFEKYGIELGDHTVLLSINGTIGNLALYNDETVILGKSAAFINCGKALSRRYLLLLMQSSFAKNYFDSEATGTTISNLSLKSIRNMPILIPPKREQGRITTHLEKVTDTITLQINKSDEAIELLKEYRTALISAAVTGKIDVRAPHPGPPQPGEGEIPADRGGNPLPSQGRVATEGRREGSRLTRHDWQPPPALWARLKPLAREMRKQPTPAEAKLWQRLRRKQVRAAKNTAGIKFRRQFAIGRFITDFCSPAVRLIIEVDGSIHDQKQEYDAIRTEYLEAAGFEVVRFRNEDVLGNLQGVMEMIDAVVGRKITPPDDRRSSPSPGRGGTGRG